MLLATGGAARLALSRLGASKMQVEREERGEWIDYETAFDETQRDPYGPRGQGWGEGDSW